MKDLWKILSTKPAPCESSRLDKLRDWMWDRMPDLKPWYVHVELTNEQFYIYNLTRREAVRMARAIRGAEAWSPVKARYARS